MIIAALCLYQGRRERKYKHKDYREAFPFSHYPMYDGFDDFDYAVFLADGAGQPLPIESLTHGGCKANALKKKFDDKIDDLKDELGKSVRNRDATPAQMQPAGESTLRWLCESYPDVAAREPVRLYLVRLTMKGRRGAGIGADSHRGLRRSDPMITPRFRPQSHSASEILIMRVLFALVVMDVIPSRLDQLDLQMPVGLAGMGMDLSWLPAAMPWLKWVSYGLLVVYALGRVPWLTTALLFGITVLVGTYTNSNAIKHHHQIVSLILLGQAVWYGWWRVRQRLRHSDDALVRDRWAAFVSQQAIVAAYVVTGLTKVNSAGLIGWVREAGDNYALQVRKTNLQATYSTLAANTGAGTALEGFLASHPTATYAMLGGGLAVELFAFLALLGRPWSFTYGWLLIGFHLLNSLFMNLNFRWHVEVIFIFLILPPVIAVIQRRVAARR